MQELNESEPFDEVSKLNNDRVKNQGNTKYLEKSTEVTWDILSVLTLGI